MQQNFNTFEKIIVFEILICLIIFDGFLTNYLILYMLAKPLIRLSLALGFLLCNCPVWSQTEMAPLITDVQVSNGDSTYRLLYLYGDANLKSLETKYAQYNNEWIRKEQTEWIYSNGRCETQYTRKWVDYEWMPLHKIAFTYLNNLRESEIHYDFKNANYLPLNKHTWFYAGERLTTETDSVYTENRWKISSKNSYVFSTSLEKTDTVFFTKYDADTICFQSYIEFKYNESALPYLETYAEKKDNRWLNCFQTKTFYEKNTNRKSYQVNKTWNNSAKKWTNSQNISYQYNAQNEITKETFQRWQSQSWENDLRNEYFYNTDNKLDRKVTYKQIYDEFRPISSVNYTEFQFNKASLIEAKNEFWGGEKGSAINTFLPFVFNEESVVQFGSKIKISYIPVDNTKLKEVDGQINKGLIRVYPNPSTSIFYFNTKKFNVKSWTVNDISGKTILQKSSAEESGVVDLGDFKSGIYILRVVTTEGVLTQKLIKI